MQDYGKAAQAYPKRPELQFDRGDAAYKAGEYSEAEEAFRKSLETPNLNVQEQSYYNLGNTQYEHGAALVKADRARTIELWKSALHSYESALKLKPAPDTQHNYEVVKRKLDELMQQQQGGNQGQSGSGQGQSGGDSQQSGQTGGSGSNGNGGNSNGAPGDTNGQPNGNADKSADATRTYSGKRSQDQVDPQIRSRQEAENLLDSLQGQERRITARSYSSNGEVQLPSSGKDW